MDRNDAMQVVIIIVDTVALRKESVDRNPLNDVTHGGPIVSLSARRAWIEIVMQEIAQQRKQRRSPQGERG